jgi:anti-anti-sigma regulatory factor
LNKIRSSDFCYYMHDGPNAFSFEIAGRLSDDGARELQQARRTALSSIDRGVLIVDLSYVTSISIAGRHLLREWHDRGAQLVARSPDVRAMVQSTTGKSVELSAAMSHATWLPFH